MIIYYAIAVVSMAIMWLPCDSNKEYRIKLLICLSLVFFLGAFRYAWMDYTAYEANFNVIKGFTKIGNIPEMRIEYGYVLLNYLCPSFRFLIIATTLLVCIAYYLFFVNFIPYEHRLVAITLLFLCGNDTVFFMFSGIRNSIAICILLISLPYIINGNYLKFGCVTILAFLFHQSSIIIFPIAYLMGQIKSLTKRNTTILFIIAVILSIIPFELLVNSATSLVISNLDRYSLYVDAASEIGHGASLLVKASNLIICGVICFGLRDRMLNRNETMLVCLTLLCSYFNFLGPLNLRMSMYLTIVSIAGIVITYTYLKDKILNKAFLGLFMAYKGYAFFIVFVGSQNFYYDHIYNYLFDALTL